MTARPTSATGGSAESQADSLDERAWRPRPGVSLFIRTVMWVVPAFVSFVSVWATITLVDAPDGLLPVTGWWVLLIAAATAGMRMANFATRQLAPLGALFQMSLVFPDGAPSRFSTALRTHTGRQLERGALGAATSHQESAENLIVLLARLSAHDRLTRGHSERVRAYSVMLGEEIGLSADELSKLNWAALAHDVGKLDVPEAILNKNGRPTDEEWEILRGHPGAAAKFIDSLRPWLGDWVDCATQHHERYDGTGYPAGLAGDEISLAGRIVSIADAFDVMTAARSYKKPLPAEQARAELLRNAGTQFDPGLVRSFLQISLPRQSRIAGWVGWFTHVPSMLPTPLVPAIQTVGKVAAAGAVSAAALLAAPLTDLGTATAEVAAERTVPLEDDPVPPASTTTTPPTEDRALTDPADTPADPDDAVLPTTTTTTPGDAPTNPGTPTIPVTTTTPGTPTTSITIPEITIPTTTTITIPTTTTTTTTTTTSPPPAGTVANDDAQTILNVLGGLIDVLANDDFGASSADTGSLRVVDQPERGTATVIGTMIRYAPDFLETSGTDTFTYEVCSIAGSCDGATVVVTLAL